MGNRHVVSIRGILGCSACQWIDESLMLRSVPTSGNRQEEHLACLVMHIVDIFTSSERAYGFVSSSKTFIYMYNLKSTQGSSNSSTKNVLTCRPAGTAGRSNEKRNSKVKSSCQRTRYADRSLPAVFFGLIMKNAGRRDIISFGSYRVLAGRK